MPAGIAWPSATMLGSLTSNVLVSRPALAAATVNSSAYVYLHENGDGPWSVGTPITTRRRGEARASA